MIPSLIDVLKLSACRNKSIIPLWVSVLLKGENTVGIGHYYQKIDIHTSSWKNARKKLPFEWIRPPKIPFIYRTETQESLKTIDLKETKIAYRNCKELETASENVKKLLSIEFEPKRYAADEIKLQYMAAIQKHCLDTGSLEATIAALSIKIRNMQIHMKKFVRNKQHGSVLKETIDKRNKLLSRLRKKDYERFEWLTKELNIAYQLPPRFHYRIERKKCIREMTQKYCEDMRIAKLSELREKLKAQQADFLKEKQEKLRFIVEEEKALGLRSEDEQLQQNDEEILSLPLPIASSLTQIARTAEGPYVEPVYVKRKLNKKG